MRELFHRKLCIYNAKEEGLQNGLSIIGHSPFWPLWPICYCLLFITIATFLSACDGIIDEFQMTSVEDSGQTMTRLTLSNADGLAIKSLDVFFFNDDSLKRLDSWQHIDGGQDQIQGGSRGGKKILAVVANTPANYFKWGTITSYYDLQEVVSELSDDIPEQPVMSAMTKLTAGTPVTLQLRPLMAQIVLRSIKCDLSYGPYEDEVLTDVRAYLTNVSARCPVMAERVPNPQAFLNAGGFHPGDVASLRDSSMLTMRLPNVGKTTIFPNRSLFCYPNELVEEGLGQPFTRLVIEGKIGGKKYYYPLSINHEGFNKIPGVSGLSRNVKYVVDLSIYRLGSTDPDTPVSPSVANVTCTPLPWTQKETVTVPFTLQLRSHNEDSSLLANPLTKSSQPDETGIEDVNVFIFGADSMLVDSRFFSSRNLTVGSEGTTFTMDILRDCSYTILVVANAGYSLTWMKNWSEVISYRRHLAYPDEFTGGMPMSGRLDNFRVATAMNGTNAQFIIPMSRMVAKISVRMDRTALDSDVKMNVRSMRIGNCPSSALAFGKSRAENVRQTFSSGYLLSDASADAVNIAENGKISRKASLYMLENMQGGNETGLASYLEMEIEYQSAQLHSPAGKYLIYRFYLDDGTGNYDLERNCEYHFTVRPEGDGLTIGDSWRVDRSSLEAFPAALLSPYTRVERMAEGLEGEVEVPLHRLLSSAEGVAEIF